MSEYFLFYLGFAYKSRLHIFRMSVDNIYLLLKKAGSCLYFFIQQPDEGRSNFFVVDESPANCGQYGVAADIRAGEQKVFTK